MARSSDLENIVAELLLRLGSARIEEIASHLSVSKMTVHRHVSKLEQKGFLRRFQGMVTVRPTNLYESTYRYRSIVRRTEKDALARAAAEYVDSGQTLLLDDSTTALSIITHLASIEDLTLITNSASTLELLTRTKFKFIQIGGHYHEGYHSYLGLFCERALELLKADIVYMSSSSLDHTSLYHQDDQVVRIKQAMMKAAKLRVLGIDASKLEQSAAFKVAELLEFDVVLCTDNLSHEASESIRANGVNLKIVKLP